MSQTSLSDLQKRAERLSDRGDPLERLAAVIDWHDCRPLPARARAHRGARDGRPAYDGVLLFRMLALSSPTGLSDEQVEHQVKDRLSFMRFPGPGLHDRIPDATTLWLFREELIRQRLLEQLFDRFEVHLRQSG